MLRHLLGIVKVADHQVFADSNGETTEEEGTEEDAGRFIQRQEGQHPDHELRGAAIAEGRLSPRGGKSMRRLTRTHWDGA